MMDATSNILFEIEISKSNRSTKIEKEIVSITYRFSSSFHKDDLLVETNCKMLDLLLQVNPTTQKHPVWKKGN